MEIILGERTEETVAIYFAKSQQEEIRVFLPQKARTLEEALTDYRETLLPDSTSYGRTILFNRRYVGDIWCYGIHTEEEPGAMLSYCVFEKSCLNCGVATEAVKLFLRETAQRFGLKTIGAFVYEANAASIRVLEKSGFQMIERFTEDGVASRYYQKRIRIDQ